MVVSCHVTVANYEYLVYWRFYQDGNIECEVGATGIMVTTPYAEGEAAPPYGTVVDNRTYAPFHQHFLVARLDLDVDGSANTVVEVDSVAPPVSDENPYGLALVTQSTPITSEASSARDYNWDTQRGWKVVNPDKLNRHGTPVAYKLVPAPRSRPSWTPRRRNTFGRRSSATPYGSRGTTTTSAGRAASTPRSPPLTPV